MSYFVPSQRLAETLPGAEALASFTTVPGEERIYDLPELHSWLAAGAPDGSGNYFDKSSRGNNWVQSSGGARPSVVSNALSTGFSAFSFDGTTALSILSNFTAPVGDWAVVAVASLDAGTSTGDGNDRVILGSSLAVASQYQAGQRNRKGRLTLTGNSTQVFSGTTLSTAAPHLFVYDWSASELEASVAVDGGAWTTTSLATTTNTLTLKDCTAQIGMTNTSYAKWYGYVFEVLLFSKSLYASNSAATLALVTSVLKTKYGIT